MHATDSPWAERDLGDWTPLQGRVWGELGAGNVMYLFTDTSGTSTVWSPAVDANIWRRIDIVHDPVANQVKARFDGGAFAGPYNDMNQSGQPIASVAIEGQAEGGVFFMDNYIIRRYVEPEPVVNVGAEEVL
jgi:hypothetical protein